MKKDVEAILVCHDGTVDYNMTDMKISEIVELIKNDDNLVGLLIRERGVPIHAMNFVPIE